MEPTRTPQANSPWRLLGTAFDPLDDPVKVETKKAYLDARARGALRPPDYEDPYELLAAHLARLLGGRAAPLGRWEVPGWLRPKPPEGTSPRDLDPGKFSEFLDGGGVEATARRLEEYILEAVLPGRPLILGVDHGLTAAPLRALSRIVGPENLGLVVFDAHLDALGAALRESLRKGDPLPPGEAPEEPLTCGNFLLKMIEEGTVDAKRVLMLGVADYPGRAFSRRKDAVAQAYRKAYLAYERRGVAFLPAAKLAVPGGPAMVRRAVAALGASHLYVSLDADVGAGRACRAVRFQDLVGLEAAPLLSAAAALGEALRAPGAPLLAGLDVMEIDVHLAGRPLPEGGGTDRTRETVLAMAERILQEG